MRIEVYVCNNTEQVEGKSTRASTSTLTSNWYTGLKKKLEFQVGHEWVFLKFCLPLASLRVFFLMSYLVDYLPGPLSIKVTHPEGISTCPRDKKALFFKPWYMQIQYTCSQCIYMYATCRIFYIMRVYIERSKGRVKSFAAQLMKLSTPT